MRAVHLTGWLWLSKGISGNLFLGDECGPYWNMKATFVCFCQFCGCARSSSVCSYKWLQHINCRAYRWAHCLCPETFPFSITTNHCSLHFFNTPKIFSLWNDFFFCLWNRFCRCFFYACNDPASPCFSFVLKHPWPYQSFPLCVPRICLVLSHKLFGSWEAGSLTSKALTSKKACLCHLTLSLPHLSLNWSTL